MKPSTRRYPLPIESFSRTHFKSIDLAHLMDDDPQEWKMWSILDLLKVFYLDVEIFNNLMLRPSELKGCAF
eukprot:scaffold1927_cov333-Pavlova_lutheri.AAC.1